MKNEIDTRFILQVFDKITRLGKLEDGAYLLDGVKAYSDFDGYTLFLEDALVQLRFGFHNRYDFEYESTDHREQFEKKLKQIDQKY